MSRPLTRAQRALVERLRGGRLLIHSVTPGREDEPGKWYIEHPYSEEDGRTCWSLGDRGLLRHEGEGLFTLSAAATPAPAPVQSSAEPADARERSDTGHIRSSKGGPQFLSKRGDT